MYDISLIFSQGSPNVTINSASPVSIDGQRLVYILFRKTTPVHIAELNSAPLSPNKSLEKIPKLSNRVDSSPHRKILQMFLTQFKLWKLHKFKWYINLLCVFYL